MTLPHRASRILARRVIIGLAVTLATAAGAPAAVSDDAMPSRAAGVALARGNLKEAVALYTTALEDKTLPNDRRALLLSDRGVAHARLQNPKAALDDFNRAVKLYPEYAAIYNNRGTVLLTIGAVGEAMKDFNRALLLAPGYAAAYVNRASARVRQSELALAISDYTRAIALVPANPAAFTGRGRAHLAARRPYTAIRDFKRATEFDARFGAAYSTRAEANMIIERYDAAIEDFSRAIAFDARNAELYVLRGNAYLAAGNPASAVKDFTTAIEITPRHARAHAERGLAYAKADAYDEALDDFARAIELDPRSARAFAYRAWTYRLRAPALARKEVQLALKLDPNSVEAHWASGAIEEAQGQNAQAVAAYSKAVAIDPRMKEARLALQRLGAAPLTEAQEIVEAAHDGWRVFTRWPQYMATNDQLPHISVDVEMLGEGRPRILAWEAKTGPFAGIGVLRFHAGVVEGEAVERVAIVDVKDNKVVAVETVRRGARKGRLTWSEGRLVLVTAEGTREELVLRPDKPPPPPQVASQRRRDEWTPWGSGWSRQRRRPKTLFELLFGN